MAATIAGVVLRALDNWGKRELFKGAMKLAWLTKTLPDLRSFLPLIPDTTDPKDSRTEMETISDIFFFNGMGQDEANGRFTLDDDELELRWEKPVSEQPVFAQIEGLMKQLSAAMASDDPASGYVKPAGSTEVHPGLFIVDASVFPGAVVAHPTLTIMAQALKTMDGALA